MERSVYLMKCGDYYKIGVSKNPQNRLKQLDMRPLKTEIVAQSLPFNNAMSAEQDLLSYCEYYRVGGEWFLLPEEIAEIVARNISDKDYQYLY